MDVERAVLGLAAHQHGVISRWQLERAGLSAASIKHRVARGSLRRMHRGVYLLGPIETEYAPPMAAVLATGGVVSSYPAAVVWDWRPPREGPMHVIVPRKVRGRPGIVVHHTQLDPRDITRRHGIPVTSAARTLLDLAAAGDEFEPALNEAMLQRRVSLRSLNEQFSRYPNHRGTAALKRATATGPHLTRSDLERIALALIRKAGLPRPESNVKLEGIEVDLLWRDHSLVVEIDSWAFHSVRRSFEGDRRRDQVLVGKGWRVIRITDRQLATEPELVVATLARALFAAR